MNHKVGIWLDHKKAVIVSASEDHVTAKTLEYQIGPHARYSGGGSVNITSSTTQFVAVSRPMDGIRRRRQCSKWRPRAQEPLVAGAK